MKHSRVSVTVAFWIAFLLSGLLCLGFFTVRYYRFHLPHQWRFPDNGSLHAWQQFGGAWHLIDDAVMNDSEERGAKLLSGASWSDYQLDADVQLRSGSGDAGVIVRASAEEDGVDSYRGYYIGLRAPDNTLTIGRADFSWQEAEASRSSAPLLPLRWYHLHVVAVGCRIAGLLTDMQSQTLAAVLLREPPGACFSSGRIGLRSVSTSAVWRQVRAAPADQHDLDTVAALRRQSTLVSPPRTVEELLDYYRQLLAASATPLPFVAPPGSLQSVRDLALSSSSRNHTVLVRGEVTLLHPVLFVQDATGGVAAPGANLPQLRLGDQVEVEGHNQEAAYPATLHDARVRLLWPSSPSPPLFISVESAVTGIYEGRLIELEARLQSRSVQNGMLFLELATNHQTFAAVLDSYSSPEIVQSNLGSLLHITGVCTSDVRYRPARLPFVLLLRSAADVQTVSGPPLLSLHNLIIGAVVFAFLVLLGIVAYIRAEQWRLHAVLEERQRLAHELHDTLAQSFAGIGLQLRALQRRMPASLPALRADLELAAELVRQGHQEARRSISLLRPGGNQQIQLIPALVSAARRIIADDSISIETRVEGEERRIPLRTLDILFRAGQEGIANSVRHASAQHILVSVTYGPQSVTLRIQDDGVGLEDKSFATDGFGLKGIAKRVAAINGNVRLQSAVPSGACLIVDVPLTSENPLKRIVYALTRRLRA